MTINNQIELEAAAFRRLVKHLRERPEVQNIELMILADFCRNCLAKWYTEAGKELNIPIDYEDAREMVYGMPYEDWKNHFQTKATPEQLAAYASKKEA